MAHRVIVKNLDFQLANDKEICQLFHQYGFTALTRSDVSINRSGDARPGKHCVAFVVLQSEFEVQSAINLIHGSLAPDLAFKPIHVQRALPRMRTLQLRPPGSLATHDPYVVEMEGDPSAGAAAAYNAYCQKKEKRDRKRRKRANVDAYHDTQENVSTSADVSEVVVVPDEFADNPPWKRRQRQRERDSFD